MRSFRNVGYARVPYSSGVLPQSCSQQQAHRRRLPTQQWQKEDGGKDALLPVHPPS